MVSRELVSNTLGVFHRAIRIAFVGHRPNRLPPESVERVRAAIASALPSIEAAGKEAAVRSVKFTLVCALAEGADRIAAEAALARGWRLEAPLPFSISRYEQDFPDTADAFQSLLKRAAKVRPLTQYDTGPDPAQGYSASGRMIIKGADAAMIVWDGQPGHGPGGTADIAAQALDQGEPVLWIGIDERQRSKLILPAAEKARKGERAQYLSAALAARFEKTERPEALQAAAV